MAGPIVQRHVEPQPHVVEPEPPAWPDFVHRIADPKKKTGLCTTPYGRVVSEAEYQAHPCPDCQRKEREAAAAHKAASSPLESPMTSPLEPGRGWIV